MSENSTVRRKSTRVQLKASLDNGPSNSVSSNQSTSSAKPILAKQKPANNAPGLRKSLRLSHPEPSQQEANKTIGSNPANPDLLTFLNVNSAALLQHIADSVNDDTKAETTSVAPKPNATHAQPKTKPPPPKKIKEESEIKKEEDVEQEGPTLRSRTKVKVAPPQNHSGKQTPWDDNVHPLSVLIPKVPASVPAKPSENQPSSSEKYVIPSREKAVVDEPKSESRFENALDRAAAANVAAIRAGTIQRIVDSRSKGEPSNNTQAAAQEAEILKYVEETSDTSVLNLLQPIQAELRRQRLRRRMLAEETAQQPAPVDVKQEKDIKPEHAVSEQEHISLDQVKKAVELQLQQKTNAKGPRLVVDPNVTTFDFLRILAQKKSAEKNSANAVTRIRSGHPYLPRKTIQKGNDQKKNPQNTIARIPIKRNEKGDYTVVTKPLDDPAAPQVRRVVIAPPPGFSSKTTMNARPPVNMNQQQAVQNRTLQGVRLNTNPVMGYTGLQVRTPYPRRSVQTAAPLLKRMLLEGTETPLINGTTSMFASKPIIAHPCESGMMLAKKEASLEFEMKEVKEEPHDEYEVNNPDYSGTILQSGEVVSSNGFQNSYKPAKMPGLITPQSLHNGALEKFHAQMREDSELRKAQLAAQYAAIVDNVVKEAAETTALQRSIQNIINQNNESNSNFLQPVKVIWRGRSIIVPEYMRCECQGLMSLWLKKAHIGETLNTSPTYKCRACHTTRSFARKFSSDRKISDSTWPTVRVAPNPTMVKDFDEEASNAPPKKEYKKRAPSWKTVQEKPSSSSPRKRYLPPDHPGHIRVCKDPLHHLSPDFHCGCSAPLEAYNYEQEDEEDYEEGMDYEDQYSNDSVETEQFSSPRPVVTRTPSQPVFSPAEPVVASIQPVVPPKQPIQATQPVSSSEKPKDNSTSAVETNSAPKRTFGDYAKLNLKQLLESVFELTGRQSDELNFDDLERVPAREFVNGFHKFMTNLI